MIENKIGEDVFMDDIYKSYKVSEKFDILDIINSLLDNGISVHTIDIKQKDDIDCKIYQGTYNVNSFISDVYGELPDTEDFSFEIELQDERVEKIMFFSNSNILTAICKNKEFEITDVLSDSIHLKF